MGTAPLFLVDALPDGERLLLDGPEGRHAATVKRLRVGEAVVIGDGRGGLAEARVAGTGRDTVELTIVDRRTVAAPAPRVLLVQALVKGRGELAVELATEAGVDGIVPWRASRCVARWDDGARGAKALARWRSTVREAAKQARRPWVPQVEEPVGTTELANRIRRRGGGLVLHEGAADPLAAASLPGGPELIMVVGPEGGITGAELVELVTAGAQPVRLGSEVLRASTAAAVALGALAVLTGRWSEGINLH